MKSIVEDRRQYLRITVEDTVITFEVSKKQLSIRYTGIISDIGEGGIGIKAFKCPEPGEIVLLDFILPDTLHDIEDIKCGVIWSKRDRFGLNFFDPSEKLKNIIKQYLWIKINANK